MKNTITKIEQTQTLLSFFDNLQKECANLKIAGNNDILCKLKNALYFIDKSKRVISIEKNNNSNNITYSAFENGFIDNKFFRKEIGYLIAEPHNKTSIELMLVSVLKNYQRCGIASMLLKGLKEYALVNNITHIIADSDATDKNSQNLIHGFYSANNFNISKNYVKFSGSLIDMMYDTTKPSQANEIQSFINNIITHNGFKFTHLSKKQHELNTTLKK